jgi:hypothetical protein
MKKTLLILLLILIAIQFIRPEKTNPPVNEKTTLKAPENVMEILKRSCYDCHSNETVWPWYSNIAPLSWSIISHVNDGRKALNFSNWTKIDPKIKEKRIKRAIKTTANGMMPLSTYLWLHEDAKLSKEDKEVLKGWFEGVLER